MPWQEVSTMSLRYEFVKLASQEDANMTQLCQRFGISRKTGYKWLDRYLAQGKGGLHDQSRRPVDSPYKTAPQLEKAIVALRRRHPEWGGRKLRKRLLMLGHREVPTASTITGILHRHGLIEPEESVKHQTWKRFEHDTPNQLWQMDFKGHFPLFNGRCHPLTVLDDHARFNLCLQACANEKGDTVQRALTATFRCYGLPERMTMDNGAPWGLSAAHPYTPLTVWLIRLGIGVSHSRPYHPQTQGKDERFHRTLQAELLRYHVFHDLAHCQRHFNAWRDIYNLERPHEALDMDVPANRYQPSPRPFPEALPPIEYGPDDHVRKVQGKGEIHFRGYTFLVGKSFHGYPVALRPRSKDGCFSVYFCHQHVIDIDLRNPTR